MAITTPIRYYRLGDLTDELGGTSLTQSGTVSHSNNTYPGVNNSGTYGASFTGASNYLPGPNYDIGGGNFSFSLWFETDQINEATTERCAFIITNGSDQYVQVSQNDADQMRILWNDSSGNITQTTTVAANTWYHIVGTADGTNVKMYLNGSLIDTDLLAEPTGTTSFNIGRHTTDATGRYFKGHIGEVGIWNVALSPTEVTDLYAAGAGVSYPFPVGSGGIDRGYAYIM